MIKFDYLKKDMRVVNLSNNEKKYFIKSGRNFVEVSAEVFRLYKADYMRTYRANKKEYDFLIGRYRDDSLLAQYMKETHEFEINNIESIVINDMIVFLLNALSSLNDEENFIIHALFFEEKSEATIAKELNISQQALNKKKKKILKFLKNQL